MRRFFNKLATGVMVATMAFTALAPVTTMAAEASFDCDIILEQQLMKMVT